MKHISQIIAEMMAKGKLPVPEYCTDSAAISQPAEAAENAQIDFHEKNLLTSIAKHPAQYKQAR
jgi:hypothetical protein